MIKKITTNPIKGKALGKTKMEAPSGRIKGEQRLAVSKAAEKSNKRAIDAKQKQKTKKGKNLGLAVAAAPLAAFAFVKGQVKNRPIDK